MIRLYCASKFHRAEMWKKWEKTWPSWMKGKFTINSRWIWNYHGTIPDSPVFARIAWEHDVQDVMSADILICFAEPEDKLRGALVEAGVALATGKRVILAGESEDFGTWQYHPLVQRVAGLQELLQVLRTLTFGRI